MDKILNKSKSWFSHVFHREISIRWKVFNYLLMFSAILLLILWFMQTILLESMYKSVRKSEIDQAISLVRKNINSDDLSLIVTELAESKDILIRPTSEFINPQNRGMGRMGMRIPETLTKVETFTLSDGQDISLTFYAIISPVDATIGTLRIQMYFITVVMIIFSVGIAMLIARHVSKPIQQISKAATSLAKGDFTADFSATGFLEINRLSETLTLTAKELGRVDSLRRELMSNISHDLRTPLSLIYSYAEMMHDFPAEATKEQLRLIMDETSRLSSLVNDVLDMSGLEEGMTYLNSTEFNLTKSLESATRRVSDLVFGDGIEVLFNKTSNEDIFITADEQKLTQAVYNLIINAVNFCGEDKKVYVNLISDSTHARIEVHDNGVGISPEDLPHIWERYYKSDKNHLRAKKGTGLGLSIVRKIVALHNGEYGVESDLGEGSTFWLKFPLSQ